MDFFYKKQIEILRFNRSISINPGNASILHTFFKQKPVFPYKVIFMMKPRIHREKVCLFCSIKRRNGNWNIWNMDILYY